MTLLAWARRHALLSFLVLAFAFSWAAWVPMAIVGARALQGQAWPSHLPGLFGPAIAAFVMMLVLHGRAGLAELARRSLRWRVHWTWYAVALSPLAFYAIAAVALAAMGRRWPDLREMGKFSSLPIVSVPLMFVLLLLTSYGEEAGWRGSLAHEMLRTRGFLSTSIVIGLIWTLWHVPSLLVIENYRAMGPLALPQLGLGILGGSILLTWLYRGSGNSVLLVTIWHATYNLVAGTAAARGLVAAVVSTAVMAWAALIVVIELRRRSVVTSTPARAGRA